MTNKGQINIGDRVAILNNSEIKGIVMYYGEIGKNLGGEWVGIDWDDDKRGKHNGLYNNVQYFKARSNFSGSFVRPDTLIYGTELIAELKKKYAYKITPVDEKRWEFVDFDRIFEKQKNVFELKCIVLHNSTVAFVNPLLTENFTKCIELDLSNTFLTKWQHLFKILNFFPILKTLHLSNNRIEGLSQKDIILESKLPEICEIALNNSFVSEKTANFITKIFNNIQEIYLANNNLTLYQPQGNINNLKKIDLQGNKIEQFSQIDSLKLLPNLEFLNLSSCSLKSIVLGKNPGFNKLNALFVEDNCISEWNSVNELARLPNLQKLLIKGSKLKNINEIDVRELIIAKLPNLIELDRSDISEVSRRSAELYVVLRLQDSDNLHTKTIERLKNVYNVNETDLKVNNLKDHVFNINSKKINLEYKNFQIEKNLSMVLSIHRIVSLASKLFDFDPDDVCCVELKRKGFLSERLSRTKDRLLSQFNLEDGDTISFLTEDKNTIF